VFLLVKEPEGIKRRDVWVKKKKKTAHAFSATHAKIKEQNFFSKKTGSLVFLSEDSGQL